MPFDVISLNCDAGLALGDLKNLGFLSAVVDFVKVEPTIITCEMFFVFGFLRASSMKYLSPIGVCFTVTSNTEQSGGKISDNLDIFCCYLAGMDFRTGSPEF